MSRVFLKDSGSTKSPHCIEALFEIVHIWVSKDLVGRIAKSLLAVRKPAANWVYFLALVPSFFTLLCGYIRWERPDIIRPCIILQNPIESPPQKNKHLVFPDMGGVCDTRLSLIPPQFSAVWLTEHSLGHMGSLDR